MPSLAAGPCLASFQTWIDKMLAEASNPWEAVLLLGQLVFFSRFAVQWIATERKGAVVLPEAFWWLSLFGAAITLVAVIFKHEPVLMAAQVFGLVIYSRNLVIHRRTPVPVGDPA
jgi:lipid-A-disaccharide synthase-like uncharacterized protein